MKNAFLGAASIALVLLPISSIAFAQGAASAQGNAATPARPSAPPAPAVPPATAIMSAPTLSVPGATMTVTADAGSTANPSPELKIFSLKYADAASLDQLLKQVSDCVVAPDVRSNQIVVSGSKKSIELAETIIKGLDVPAANRSTGGGLNVVTGTIAGAPPSIPGTIPFPAEPRRQAGSDGSSGASDYQQAQQVYREQLQAADTAIKQADAQAKQFAEVLKRFQDISKSGDGESEQQKQAYQAMQQLIDADRVAAENQRRAAEQQRRQAEQMMRNENGGTTTVNPLNFARTVIIHPELSEIDQQIANLATTIRALSADQSSDEKIKQLVLLRKKLEATVGKQFDEHQQSASKQLDELRSRLDKLEKEISDRASQRSEIIEKRMDELLSQNSPTLPLVGSGTIIIKDGPAGGERVLKFNGNPPQVIIQGKDLPGASSGARSTKSKGETSGGSSGSSQPPATEGPAPEGGSSASSGETKD